ncbi:MAG: Tetraacyldisaccharide 4'-kinase [Alphaproteobacteria bacterium MarineAlpha9_Bin4]|nr:tetraacyldisaccharide 4'-kinase [Pelagibacterales bacterium]PPR26654.1 MAG: Tetraacyldisaccharide 4'-kinase [Alphaproteobacteria bacterium MarineAlpha9_Bin4]
MKTPKFWFRSSPVLEKLLFPLSCLWMLGSSLNRVFTNPIKFNIPVICVGNLIAGGGGKTPVTIKLAKFLIKKGHKVHIIKKQYKSKNKEKLILVKKNSDPKLVGDEALLTAKVATTWLVKKRSTGIEKAIKCGANIVILDDGHQDYSIVKDYSILTIKDAQEFGNSKIIPAGPLRESIERGFRKADHIFYYGKINRSKFNCLKKNIPISLVKVQHNKKIIFKRIKNKNVLAFSGIAHPDNFFNSIAKYNLKLIKKIEFPDHYSYTVDDIKRIVTIAKNFKLSIVTTEKDYVKISKKFRAKINSIPLQIKFDENNFYKLFYLKVNKNG